MKPLLLRTFLFAAFLLFTHSVAYAWSVNIMGIWYYVDVTGYGSDAEPNPATVGTNSSFSGDLVIPAFITFDYTYALKDSHGNYVRDSNGNYIYNTRSLTTPVTSISGDAFKGTDVTSVTIGSNVKSIGYSSFNSCTKMKSLSVPSSVETIGQYAFGGAHSLTDLYWNVIDPNGNGWDSNYNNIGYMNTNNLERVTFGPNVKVIPAYLLSYSKVTNIVIPNSVTSIGGYAFRGASQLRTIDFGNSVRNIAHDAFYGCSSLEVLAFPASLEHIGSSAFQDCTSLTDVTINRNSTLSLEAVVFQNCSSLRRIILPDLISTIPGGTFRGCRSLMNIIIPQNVTTIGGYAFEDCSSLSSLSIGPAVSSIGINAFNNCYNLTELNWYAKSCATESSNYIYSQNIESVTIGEEVEMIPHSFVRYAKIKTVTIPKSVKTVNNYSFLNIL